MDRKLWKGLCVSLLLLCILTGCVPGNYTTKHQKELTEAHMAEVTRWFENKLPKAKVKSGEAYSDGIDLYSVIKGTYTVDGMDYLYYYDYYNDRMYLEEGYQDMVDALTKKSAAMVGKETSEVRLTFTSHGFQTKLENDSNRQSREETEDARVRCEEVLPYGVQPEEFAEMMFEGDNGYYSYAMWIYADQIPEYETGYFQEAKSLDYIHFRTFADWDGEKIYEVTYYDTMVIKDHMVLQKLDQEVYGGFSYEERVRYDDAGNIVSSENTDLMFSDQIVYQREGNDFYLTIPEGTRPILFMEKGKYCNVFGDGSDEKEFELEGMKKESRDTDKQGYDLFASEFLLPHSELEGYTYTMKSTGSPYKIRRK